MNTQPPPQTPSATPTTERSSKKKCIAAIATASLLASALPASAISISIVENSDIRIAFDVVWGEVATSPTEVHALDTLGPVVTSVDVYEFPDPGNNRIRIIVDPISRFIPPEWGMTRDDFTFAFGPHPPPFAYRSLITADFSGAGNRLTDILPLAEGPFGARFLYGAGYPPKPPEVPDHGSTALLLGVGLFGLVLARRGISHRY